MQALEVVSEDPRWEAAGLEDIALRAVAATLARLGVDPDRAEVTVMGCDDARIAVLNGDFRAKPTPTNVLSWPAEERGADRPGGAPQPLVAGPDGLFPLGDMALAFETCAAEAAAGGLDLTDHATHLVVHATLHLLGYDHIHDADAALMEGIETEILGKMGLHDPYREE